MDQCILRTKDGLRMCLAIFLVSEPVTLPALFLSDCAVNLCYEARPDHRHLLSERGHICCAL